MVEEIKAGKEPSPLPSNLVDSFRATLTQKVQALDEIRNNFVFSCYLRLNLRDTGCPARARERIQSGIQSRRVSKLFFAALGVVMMEEVCTTHRGAQEVHLFLAAPFLLGFRPLVCLISTPCGGLCLYVCLFLYDI